VLAENSEPLSNSNSTLLIGMLWLILLTHPVGSPAQDAISVLKTRPELSDYQETSRYADVMEFFAELQKRSPLVHLQTFGRTHEKRDLPLAVIAEPPLSSPAAARRAGKTIVLLLGNIHGGEVEGKEASQEIARRLAGGDLRKLLSKVVVLVAPIYNADGNERISLTNRTEQHGPIRGVGVRANAQGLDLNRDFMKVAAPETSALLQLFNEWDPLLTVDLHTTDGSFHGYHLTYSTPLNPSADAALLAYHRDKMMPALTKAMLRTHGFRTYFYGNFATEDSLARQNFYAGARSIDPNRPRIWRAFSSQPRVGFNYVGLRNRLCILSEAYSYLDFRRRIEATSAFLEEILRYSAAHAGEIRRLTQQADARTTNLQSKPARTIGVEYAPKALPKPVPILVGAVINKTNPLSGAAMTVMVEDAVTPVKMPDYGLFAATRSVPIARAYLLPRPAGLPELATKLQTHGIRVEELALPLTTKIAAFTIGNVTRPSGRARGNESSKVTGHYEEKEITFAPGTYLVRTSQPLGLLAAYLLEPESDDGFVAWNFLDSHLNPQTILPIYKLMESRALADKNLTVPARVTTSEAQETATSSPSP
jgi:hypothetical protein